MTRFAAMERTISVLMMRSVREIMLITAKLSHPLRRKCVNPEVNVRFDVSVE